MTANCEKKPTAGATGRTRTDFTSLRSMAQPMPMLLMTTDAACRTANTWSNTFGSRMTATGYLLCRVELPGAIQFTLMS